MDLGIRGRTALVCASTRGLGRACAEALAAEGVAVVVNGRHADTVAATADDLAARFGVEARGVAADLDDPAGRRALLAACPDPDILVTNNAGPPPAAFADVTAEAWSAALQANMLSAIDLVQGVLPGMRARGFGRIVNITSAMVTSPHALDDALGRGPGGSDRGDEGGGPRRGGRQRDRQQPPARAHRHRPAAPDGRVGGGRPGDHPRGGLRRDRRHHPRRPPGPTRGGGRGLRLPVRRARRAT